MEIIYKTFEPNKGFEEAQATIYNDFVAQYNGSKVTADQIKTRMKAHVPAQDLNGIRFAFSKDQQPLAYIQYRCYQNKEGKLDPWIGYPWAVKNCPPAVQEELFSKLLTYVQEKYPDRPIFMGYISDDYTKVREFAQKKNFGTSDTGSNYIVSIASLSKISHDKTTVQEASSKDLDVLLDIATADPNLTATMNREALTKYFANKVFPDGNCIILFHESQAIASSAVLANYLPDTALIRFAAIRKGFEHFRTALYAELALYLQKHKFTNKKIIFYGDTADESYKKFLDQLKTAVKGKDIQIKTETLYKVK